MPGTAPKGIPIASRSAVVDRQRATQVLPDLVAGLEDVFGQRTFFSGREVLVQLGQARSTQNHHIRRGVMQQPVQREADERASRGLRDLA